MTKEPLDIREGTKKRKYQILVALIGASATIIAGALGIIRQRSQGQVALPAEARITGRISNAQTDDPVRKAEVSLEADGIPERTESDSKGIFSARVPASYSTVRIRVVARGFKPFDQLIARDPMNQVIPVTLEPEPQTSRNNRRPSQRDPDERRMATSPSRPKSSMASMLNTSLPIVHGDEGPWAVILFGEQERRDEVMSSVRSTLSGSGHDTVALFRKVSDEQRLASDVFRGSSDLLRELQAGQFCSHILVGKLSVARIGASEGITFARATLSFHVVAPAGDLLKSFELSEKGGGEDDSSARRHAVDELIDALPRELPARID